MVVDNFNVMRAIVMPCETDTPLIVDSDAELPLAVTAQGLEAIAWQEHKRFKGVGGIKYPQTLFRLPDKSLKRTDAFPVMQVFGFLILKAFDHANDFTSCTPDVKGISSAVFLKSCSRLNELFIASPELASLSWTEALPGTTAPQAGPPGVSIFG